MGVYTANAYGKITVSREAIAQVAGSTVLDCYGVVDIVSRGFFDSVNDVFRRQRMSRGIKVKTAVDRITLSIFVMLKYGISIDAVAQSVKKAVKYNVEKFTGMMVDDIDIYVVGIRV